MPAKQVMQYDCDRCGRTWYLEPDVKQTPFELTLKANIEAADVSLDYKCLCDGCRKTVKALLDSLGKTTKKSSPAGRAKKKKDEPAAGTSAGQGDPRPADNAQTTSSPVVAGATPPAGGPGASGGASPTGARRPAPPGPARSTQ